MAFLQKNHDLSPSRTLIFLIFDLNCPHHSLETSGIDLCFRQLGVLLEDFRVFQASLRNVVAELKLVRQDRTISENIKTRQVLFEEKINFLRLLESSTQ